MKKVVILSVLVLFQVLFACNDVPLNLVENNAEITDESIGLLRTDSFEYAEVLRNTIRLEYFLNQIDLSNARVGGSSETVNARIQESINDLSKTKGDKFKEEANKTVSSPQMQEFINSVSNVSITGKSKTKEVVEKHQKSAPVYFSSNLSNLRSDINKQIESYEKEASKNGVHKNSEAENAVKIAVDRFEKGIMKDPKLTADQKKLLFHASSFIFTNARNLTTTAIDIATQTKNMLKNGKPNGLFNSILRIITTIVSCAIVGAIIVAIPFAIIGAIITNPELGGGGAAIGMTVGLIVGIVMVIQGDCICWYDPQSQSLDLSIVSCPC
jgi:hypothetical protein